jgi:DNA-binding CsgD family transcriptional regulator
MMTHPLDRPTSQSPHAHSELFQGVLEGLTDGILILTDQGDWIYENAQARQLCWLLNQGQSTQPVPQRVWQVCQALIESRDLYPQQPVMIESEIDLDRTATIRVRARWLSLAESQHPYLVVLLEDRQASIKRRAIAESQHYGLTPRQTEVWVLHCLGYSYREIARELFIAFDTVKKHMKDIHGKRQRTTDIL